MTSFLLKRLGIFLFVVLSLSLSTCSPSPGTQPPSTLIVEVTGQPTNSTPGEWTVQQTINFGSGPFNLTDPKVGLSDLSSYQATLTLSFDGTNDGQPSKWSKTYTMLAMQEPLARQLTIETAGTAGKDPIFIAEADGADYERSGTKDCTANAIEQGYGLSDRFEPASFLSPVIGADEAGSETVNGETANHYKFDERALGQEGQNQSQGEIWVLSKSGTVVKYILTTQGNADYFGDGSAGTLTWDYELTNVGKSLKIQIPADCPGGMINVPQLPDASNVVNTPGLLNYDTSTSLADAAAYYQKQIPDLGWKLQNTADIDDTKAFMEYKQGDEVLTVFITTDSGLTTVDILLQRSQN